MARTATRTRSTAGRQLAAAFPGDLLTGAPALGVTADEDGAQLDIFEAVAEVTHLIDAERHLGDCLPCALHLPDGHAYVSLIDVPPTADQLRTLATRTDVDVVIRQGAADALAELERTEADPTAFRDGETAEEWAARAYGVDA